MIEQNIESQDVVGEGKMKNFFLFLSSPKFLKNIFIIFFIISFILNSHQIEAAFNWTATQQTSSGARAWRDIASSSDGTKLVAVVNGGSIWTSANSGVSWTERTAAGTRYWKSVASSSDGTKLIAGVGDGGIGYLYTSTDSGATWTERTPANAAWYGLASSSDGTKLAAASGSYIWTSADSGATWTQRTSTGSKTWYGIASDSTGSKLAASPYGGYIYTSTDSGATWTAQTGSGSRNWMSISSSSDGSKYTAGVYSGYLYTSTDSGINWTQRSSSNLYRGIASSSDGNITVAGTNSSNTYPAVTTDGITWQGESTYGYVVPYGVAASSDGSKFAVSSDGNYIYTYSNPTPLTPAVSYLATSSVTQTSVSFTGYIDSTGSGYITTKGFNYGTTTGYGTNSSTSGTFTYGSVTASLTGLTCGTVYHMRTFATNISGYTGYSTDNSFSTVSCTTPVTAVGTPTGSVVQGSVLTAGALTPAGATVTYQWQNDVLNNGVFSNIAGATANTYTSTSGVLGDKVQVCVTGTGSYSGTICSASVGIITTPLTAIGATTGTLTVGSTLTAGALSPAGGTATYQWQSATTSGGTYTNISGATSSTYTLTATEATKYIKVIATATSPYTGSATSAFVGPVTTPVTAIAATTGTTTVGSTLTAGARTPAGATVSYQWAAATSCGGSYVNISGATSSTYVLTTNEIADYLKVTVTGTGSYSGTVTSACTAIVTTPMVSVSITGTPTVGIALNGTTRSPAAATVTYQWQSATTSGGTYTNISGATSSTYTLTATEATKYIKVIATGTGGYTGAVTSAFVGPVTTPVTAIAATTGTTTVSSTLTAGARTPAGATVSYQWAAATSCGGSYVNISGATSSTYVLTTNEIADYLKVTVTGTGSYSGTVTSACTAIVTTPMVSVSITGTPTVGIALNGTTLSPVGATVTYQWQSATTSGGTYTNISGATSSTYTLTATEATKYIKVIATGTGGYTGAVTSAFVGPVLTTVTAVGTPTGTTTVGSTLTAGTLTPAAATVSYQWQADVGGNSSFSNVASGGTTSTYVLTTNELGDKVRVVVTGTGNYTGTANSTAVGVITTPLTAIGSTTGTLTVGSTLTAGTLSPAGGTATYQWQSATTSGGTYTNISGATSSTYLLTATEATKYIKVVATATSPYTGSATSAFVGPILTTVTAVGTPTGTTTVGSTLTAGTLTPAAATVSYQWQADVGGNSSFSNVASGGTTSTYVLTTNELGDKVRVVVTGTGNYTGTANSTAVGVITTPLTSVTITGTTAVGIALNGTTIAPAGGTGTYQWQSATTSGGTYTNISGATSSTYTLTATEVGKYIKVVLTATSPYTGSVTSAFVGPVTQALTAIGSISGTATVGSTFTAGALTPAIGTATYQWQSATSCGGTYTNISGATSSTYVLTTGEIADYLKVVATGSGNYTGSVTSACSSIVTTPVTAISTITGSTIYGSILTAGTLTPAAATVTYQWSSSTTVGGTYTNIGGATSSTYTLVSTDVGDYLKVTVTGTGGYTGSVTSVASSVVTAKQLTIANPTLTTTKIYDGTTTAAVTAGALSGKVGADVVSINTTVATYDTSAVGSGKTITVVYTLTGANAANYLAPANYVVSTGVISDNTLTVSKTGTGTGTITTSVGSINCGVTCTNLYTNGTSVTLTATPDSTTNFVSWSGDADCTDGVVTMAGAKTCTATFTLKTFVLTLPASTGTGAGAYGGTAAGTYNYGTAISVTATPSTGSTFNSWSASGSAIACHGTNTSPCAFSLTSAASLTAAYTLIPYTLTIPASTGTGSGSYGGTAAGSVNYGTAVSITATPDITSNFVSWSASGAALSCNGTNTSPCAFSMTGIASVTAVYTLKTFALTIPASTGTGAGGYGGTAAGTYNYGTAISITATPSTGSTFNSWSASGSAIACQGTNTSPCAFSLTNIASVTAVYTVNNYTVTFNTNGGDGGSTAPQSLVYNIPTALTTNGFTKTGFSFTGWNTLANGLGTPYTDGANYTIGAAGVTLYAQWNRNNYTVTFNTNGGDGGSTAPQSLAYNTPTSLTTNGFTKTGFSFTGWNTASDGSGTTYLNNASYTIGAAGITLYAQWNRNNYIVTFNSNGGDGGSTAPQSLAYNTPTALTTNGFTKTQYTFTSWNTAANGSGTTYLNNASYTIGAADVTLYAQWTINTYILTAIKAGGPVGSLSSSTGGISGCTTSCASSGINYNTVVTVTAAAASGYAVKFSGCTLSIGGGLGNSAGCAFSISAPISITATYVAPPTVTTSSASSITMVSVQDGGSIVNIADLGYENNDERGIVYDTVSHSVNPGNNPPSSTSYSVISYKDVGTFSSNGSFGYTISNLTESTTYYVRAYSHNTTGGYSYGSEVPFTSLAFPTIEQSAYKIFSNTDNLSSDIALSSQNTPITLDGLNTPFQLKMLLHLNSAGTSLPSQAGRFKLQYAPKTPTCTIYSDVTSDTPIAFYNNTHIDPATVSYSSASDPTSTKTIISQPFIQTASTFTNSAAPVSSDQDVQWSFGLYDKAGVDGTYCIKVVRENGSALSAYNSVPEITTVKKNFGGAGSAAPADTQCSDGVDNNNNSKIDAAEDNCHLGGNINSTYLPSWDNESVAPADNSGGSGNGNGGGAVVLPQCSDGIDNNDINGIDAADLNCHQDGNINNPYLPNWDSESVPSVTSGGGGGQGGGGGDLGFFFNKIYSIFKWMPFNINTNLLLGMVGNIFN